MRCVFRRNSGSLTIDGPQSNTSRWRAVARVLRSPMDALGCALLPDFCTLCGSPVAHLSSAPICDACWKEIEPSNSLLCTRCGHPLDQQINQSSAKSSSCRLCRMAPPPFVRAVAYGPYDGPMRAAIHALKYDRMQGAAPRLSAMLAKAIGQLAGQAPDQMLVVAVPLHRSKHAQRGFNQARSLARQAVNLLRATHPDWNLTLASDALLRQRTTASQAGLTPHQRRRNVRGAFKVVDPGRVAKKHVLLIDDILTTGATARAAAQALLAAGAASVWVATLARARLLHPVGQRLTASYADERFTQGTSGNFQFADHSSERMHASPDQPSF